MLLRSELVKYLRNGGIVRNVQNVITSRNERNNLIKIYNNVYNPSLPIYHIKLNIIRELLDKMENFI
jgi:hypothetical protein